MSADKRVVPLAGPLDAEPQVPMWQALQQLSAALDGLPMGAWDSTIQLWLSEKDAGTVATIASLLRRPWIAGVEVGRGERVDEKPLVQQLRANISDLAAELLSTENELLAAEDELRSHAGKVDDLAFERDELAAGLADALGRLERLTAERDQLADVLEDVVASRDRLDDQLQAARAEMAELEGGAS